HLKNNVKWHNGEKLTADDVIFTVSLIQDPDYRSPLRNSFDGVNVDKVDDLTVKFILPQAYAAFTDLLTFGILPQSLWSNITASGASLSELNLKPVGSGPYQFKSLVKNKNGEIKEYHLTLNNNYYGVKPYIKNIIFKFFPDPAESVAAFNDGQIDGLSYLPLEQRKDLLAQNSLVFHELGRHEYYKKALEDEKVRQALALAINKEAIIKNVLNNSAWLATGPILPSSPYYDAQVTTYNYDPATAANLLKDALTSTITKGTGKKKQIVKTEVGTLELTLTVVATEENLAVANQIKADWEKIGVKVSLSQVPVEQVSDDIIHSKNYQALLYGEEVGADPDLYAFWHSSQAGDKGLNLANYNNPAVDKLLASGRVSLNFTDRFAIYKKFQELVTADAPAIFLYEPSYTYVQTKKIKGFSGLNIIEPADRFASLSDWYLKTTKKLVW
ncbi:MAG: ABC transporter substrate-binding protein, partial [Candidatus Falkowbacteria bacterium]|nr:ABC transporter substrate-binding protein [Candidatus Falkowbacteria bacterium]